MLRNDVLIGHFGWSHVFVSEESPMQSWPPIPGGGLSQDLLCFWMPLPQVNEQILHSDQSDQLPSERRFHENIHYANISKIELNRDLLLLFLKTNKISKFLDTTHNVRIFFSVQILTIKHQ